MVGARTRPLVPCHRSERFGRANGAGCGSVSALDGARVLGFVGWFDKWDRLDRLIALMKDLHARDQSVRLLLVGDGPPPGRFPRPSLAKVSRRSSS